jgi:hypothetical protein
MSNNAKSLSLADLKAQLEREIANKAKNESKGASNRGLSDRLRAFMEDQFGSDHEDQNASDSEEEFKEWVRRARLSGPFYFDFGSAPRFLEERRNSLVKNCDALNEVVLRKLARDFETRWVYTESEALRIFGAYLAPLEVGDCIVRIQVARDQAKEMAGVDLDSPGDGAVIYPRPSFIEMLSFYSAKLNFIVGFTLADLQRSNCNRRVKGRSKNPIKICFETNRMLVDKNSPLQRALRAPLPPKDEIDKLAEYFYIGGGSGDRRGSLIDMSSQDPSIVFKKYEEAFPVASKTGAICWLVDTVGRDIKVICAPAVFDAVLDSLQTDSVVVEKDQIQAAQNVMLALGDSEREELFASLYGAATRGDFQTTQSGLLTAACLGKIGASQWPSIATSVTRDTIESLIHHVLGTYEGFFRELRDKCCVPQDIFRNARSVFRLLAGVSFNKSLIRLCAGVPDRQWINIDQKPAIYDYDLNWSAFGGDSDSLDCSKRDWSRELLLGWFCGIVDLAFRLDKKGIKVEITSFRVNRAALKRAVVPDVDEQVRDGDLFVKQPMNLYTSKVEVLPNGEILCPPDIHPAIRFCLATILSYVRANTFSVFANKPKPQAALGLTDSDILDFLQVVSRNPVPTIVSDKLSVKAESNTKGLGAFAPDFVITAASLEKVKAVLDQMDNRRFFAIEIAADVWGFFDRYATQSSYSLKAFSVGSPGQRCVVLEKVLRNLKKRGMDFETSLSDLPSVGDLPTSAAVVNYKRGHINKPCLPPFARYCEFFDLKHRDSDWDNEKIGVEIFSLVPPEVRATKAFMVAMAPCLKLMKTPMDYL